MSAESGRGRVLLADDEEIVRSGLAELLRRGGFECLAADSGPDAIEKLGAIEIDALVSDIHMPGNANLEMVEAARALRPGLPVVLLTGRPSVETAARSVRIPVTAYLTKPPDIAELASVLDAAIADYRDLRLLQAGRGRLGEWEKELARIESELRAGGSDRQNPMGSYLRVTLGQVILMLAELERATAQRESTGAGAPGEYEAALRHTVGVLERTRQSFKSKELGELRKHIEGLLERSPR